MGIEKNENTTVGIGIKKEIGTGIGIEKSELNTGLLGFSKYQ